MTSWLHTTDALQALALRKQTRRLLRTRLSLDKKAVCRRLYRLLHAAVARALVLVGARHNPEGARLFPDVLALLERSACEDIPPADALDHFGILAISYGNSLDSMPLKVLRDGLAGRDVNTFGRRRPSWRYDDVWQILDCLLLQDTRGDRDVTREILDDLVPDTLPAFAPNVLTWQDSIIPALARNIIASRDFASLPILGDALEDAGCTDTLVLAHCRGPGPHYLGCHVLEAILHPAV